MTPKYTETIKTCIVDWTVVEKISIHKVSMESVSQIQRIVTFIRTALNNSSKHNSAESKADNTDCYNNTYSHYAIYHRCL